MDGRAFEELWEELQDELVEQLLHKRVQFGTHARDQMGKRKVDSEDVKHVVWNNQPDEMYKPYEYPHGEKPFNNPDPVFSITGRDRNGRWTTVAISLQRRGNRLRFLIVTVIAPVSPTSRHRWGK